MIKTIDKQKGIYYTCPDAVIMVAKVSGHFRYIRANFEHLRKNISDCPELLRIGQDVANLADLTKKVQASKVSIEATKKEISRLEILLKGLEKVVITHRTIATVIETGCKRYASKSSKNTW